MEAILSTIAQFVDSLGTNEWLALQAGLALALLSLGLAIAYGRLKGKLDDTETKLLAQNVSTQSESWASTARAIEKKAREPGQVATSSAMTYLHLLDEAAEAWLKGSQWQDALRVTEQLLQESGHAIGKPGMGENEFRAAADLIERRLATYIDLSKAANEASENALSFLKDLETSLGVIEPAERIRELRDQIAAAKTALEAKDDAKHKAA